MQQSDVMYHRVGRQAFIDALITAKLERGDHGLCVSEPESDADLYLAQDGQSGYALAGCSFGSVFSMARGRLSGMIEDARRRARRDGYWRIVLDCFAPLAPIYARHGWIEYTRVPFAWRCAPRGWRDDLGEHDVVFMYMRTAVF